MTTFGDPPPEVAHYLTDSEASKPDGSYYAVFLSLLPFPMPTPEEEQ